MLSPPDIHLELTFGTNDPALAKMLSDINRMPRGPDRLRLEAALCQWWANRCLEDAGRMEGRAAAFARRRRPKPEHQP
jgi:hypothetical protein